LSGKRTRCRGRDLRKLELLAKPHEGQHCNLASRKAPLAEMGLVMPALQRCARCARRWRWPPAVRIEPPFRIVNGRDTPGKEKCSHGKCTTIRTGGRIGSQWRSCPRAGSPESVSHRRGLGQASERQKDGSRRKGRNRSR